MKKIAFTLFVLTAAGCKAQAPIQPEPFDQVFAAISAEKIFSSSFPTLMKQLDGLCKVNAGADALRDGNVSCIKQADVKKMFIGPTEESTLSSIQSVFVGADKCEKMRTALTKLYGKAKVIKAPCYLEWKLKKGASGQQRKATIQASKDNAVYFSLEEEQGP